MKKTIITALAIACSSIAVKAQTIAAARAATDRILTITSTNAQNVNEGCNQLFITEIVSNNTVTASGLKNNYALELFNPTTSTISLSGYSLKLIKSNGVANSIPLSGTITAGGTWIICHNNADNSIKGMSACNTSSLNFSQYVAIELKYGTNTIDAFGEKNTTVVNYFNYLAFFQDPVGYTISNKIGLNSLQSIDIRRSMLARKGDTSFVSVRVFGKWSAAMGNDISNLGIYKGACNKSPKSLPIIGYVYAWQTIDEDFSLNNITDNLDLTVDVAGTYLVNQAYISPTTASINVDVCFANCTAFTNDYWNSTSSTSPGANYLRTTNNLFSGQKKATIQMTTVLNDFTPDPATLLHLTYINGNSTVGIKENYLNTIQIFPSITTENITITNATIDGNYKVIDLNGKVVLTGYFENNTNINVTSLSNGMYFLMLQTASTTSTQKFIKQ